MPRRDGFDMKTGVECEYFLISPDGSAISDGADTQAKPCYDQQALMRRYDDHHRNLRLHDHARLGARIRTTMRTRTASSR